MSFLITYIQIKDGSEGAVNDNNSELDGQEVAGQEAGSEQGLFGGMKKKMKKFGRKLFGKKKVFNI